MIRRMLKPDVTIHTDGACKGNPGKGGWGACLIYNDHRQEISGGEADTTNNRMELTAAIEALAKLNKPCKVMLYTDSRYVMDGITKWLEGWQKNNWKTANRKDVKNQDLWRRLLEESNKHEIQWHWVKGHSGDEGNDMADYLANKGILELS
jgi:ribonuclease HI